MNTISKSIVAVSAIAAFGFGGYYGMKQASLSLDTDFDKTYRQVFVELPPLIKPDSAQAWVDATRKALAEADKESLSRGVKLWFAAPGTRGVLNEMNATFAKMIDLRRDQLSSVEKRLMEERDGVEEPWIAQLPQKLQGQVKEATRTIAWLKADVGRSAELKPLAETFEAKAALLHQKVNGGTAVAPTQPAVTAGGDNKGEAHVPKPGAAVDGEPPARTGQASNPLKTVYFVR